MSSISLIPAYGRSYKNKAEVLKDWEDGKDFLGCHPVYGRAYTSKNDLPKDIDMLQFRYGKNLGKVCCVEVTA